jgi:hypothetical protein
LLFLVSLASFLPTRLVFPDQVLFKFIFTLDSGTPGDGKGGDDFTGFTDDASRMTSLYAMAIVSAAYVLFV